MKKFAFISRHKPTQEQCDLATKHNIWLFPIGDLDAFTVTPEQVKRAFEDSLVLEQRQNAENEGSDDVLFVSIPTLDGVIVVHPAMALRLIHTFPVGVFENANRAAEGEKPSFFAKELHIFV